MAKTKVALTIDADLLDRVDHLVARQRICNGSQARWPRIGKRLGRTSDEELAKVLEGLLEIVG